MPRPRTMGFRHRLILHPTPPMERRAFVHAALAAPRLVEV